MKLKYIVPQNSSHIIIKNKTDVRYGKMTLNSLRCYKMFRDREKSMAEENLGALHIRKNIAGI